MSTDPWQLWRDLALKAAAGWAPSAASGIAGSAPGTMGPGATFDRFAAEARTYFEQLAASSRMPGASAGPMSEAARRLGDRLREQLEQAGPLWGLAPAGALDSAPGAPSFGLLREHQQRAERLMQAAARAQEAQRRLQRLWSDAMREAALAFTANLPTGNAEASPEALRALYDRWIECAEQAYARSAHGAEFCQALADQVNALSAWRTEMQALYETWAKSFDLPTRSEVNSINLRLMALEQARQEAEHAVDRPKPRRASRQSRREGMERAGAPSSNGPARGAGSARKAKRR